jgi:hypothetical protein
MTKAIIWQLRPKVKAGDLVKIISKSGKQELVVRAVDYTDCYDCCMYKKCKPTAYEYCREHDAVMYEFIGDNKKWTKIERNK